MKQLLIVGLLFVPLSLQAQVVGGTFNTGVVLAPSASFVTTPEATPEPVASAHQAPQAQRTISYFDASTPQILFTVPVSAPPYLVTGLGERIELASDAGFLDSAVFNMQNISGDTLTFLVMRDSIFDVPNPLHLINLITTEPPYAVVPVRVGGSIPSATVTLHFGHIPVPKNFWLVAAAHFNSQGQSTSTFAMVCDSEHVRAKTLDNVHSGYIGIYTPLNLYASGSFDSTFTLQTGDQLFANFDITAFVDESGSAVGPATPDVSLDVYPNPATDHLRMTLSSSASFEILDALGRSVMAGVTDGYISTTSLPSGAYTIVLHPVDGKARYEHFVVQ